VAERALRAAPQVVELQHAELENAVQRAQRPDGDDYLHHERRLRAPRHVVDHRHHEKEHELLRIYEARVRVVRERRRDQRQGRVRGEWVEEAGHVDAPRCNCLHQPHE